MYLLSFCQGGQPMNDIIITPTKKISKRDLAAAVLFAVNNIPHVDAVTLEKFLELVNITGNFGSISDQEFAHKMYLLSKHVPEVCHDSLFTLAELLDIRIPTLNVGYNVNSFMEEVHQRW